MQSEQLADNDNLLNVISSLVLLLFNSCNCEFELCSLQRQAARTHRVLTFLRRSETICLCRAKPALASRSFASAASLAAVSTSNCCARPAGLPAPGAGCCCTCSCCRSRSRRALSARAAFSASCARPKSACNAQGTDISRI